MKGYVRTPSRIVDLMIAKLFKVEPSADSTVLDPGCGTGAFIDGIVRWSRKNNAAMPHVVGIDSSAENSEVCRKKFDKLTSVSIQMQDFLVPSGAKFDFILGNPPYVPITQLSESEKHTYRASYVTAVGRFDLYLLFFERALQSLKPRGRLVFITPEKFLYVQTAEPLRKLMSSVHVEEIHLLDENIFGDLVTYPAITTITNDTDEIGTSMILRDGRKLRTGFPRDGSSWLPYLDTGHKTQSGHLLEHICLRISCGVATGADSVFVFRTKEVLPQMKHFAYRTVAGRELNRTVDEIVTEHSMLIPYDKDGKLLGEDELGLLKDYLSEDSIRSRLEARTCASRKPWYAFHENPPLRDILRPKIICKDVTHHPHFWVDSSGTIVPRHSTYYIVPKDPSQILELANFLNSRDACKWLETHCQRAANGFLRVQSHVLKKLPIPEELSKQLITMTC